MPFLYAIMLSANYTVYHPSAVTVGTVLLPSTTDVVTVDMRGTTVSVSTCVTVGAVAPVCH